MDRFDPKIEIINHFDDLIQRVDIEFEEELKNYNENQFLEELECFKVTDTSFVLRFNIESSDSNKTVDLWSEKTKVIDYLNQVRKRTIEELRKEQKESVENSSRFNSLINSELINEEKRSEIFAEKFYFQVKITRSDYKSWFFNLFTFVTDFYISQSDINFLENLINNKEAKCLNQHRILDEKMVLICVLYKYFCQNLYNHKIPNHMIHVLKTDVAKIKQIDFSNYISGVNLANCSTDLSKLKSLCMYSSKSLDYITIDSLSSLEFLWLDLYSAKLQISFKNLNSLKEFHINFPNYKRSPMKLEFQSLENSNLLTISNWHDLNLNFFMNDFCYQIENLRIRFSNIGHIGKLLSQNNFPNLFIIDISHCDMTRIEWRFFDGSFPMIQQLDINFNDKLQIIDQDAFSSFINLESLYLNNNRLKRLYEKMFSNLKNLKMIDLSFNRLEKLDSKSFLGLENLNKLDLCYNQIKMIDFLSDLRQLVSLDLSCNRIESLDKSHFSNLINLEILNLSYNQLKRLDENMFSDLKNLKELDLSNNKLEIIDHNVFSNLKRLVSLDLGFNKIKSIERRVFSDLIGLEILILSYNHFECFDENIFSDLKNLKKLSLSKKKSF